jgi:hypothetical protein
MHLYFFSFKTVKMSNKDSRGGLLLPNSSSLFPMLRAQIKTVVEPAASGPAKDFAMNINNGTNKLVYNRLYNAPTSVGGSKKCKKEKVKKPTKTPTKKPTTQKNVI